MLKETLTFIGRHMNIRIARKEDALGITAQNILLAEESEHMKLNPTTAHAGVERLLTDPSKGFYLVAEEDDTIVGQVMITVEWSDWRNKPIWWVQSVFVRKEWRKKGVFTKLLREVRRRARVEKVAFLRLYAYNKNYPALHAYENTGWTQEPYKVYRHSV
jgi:GNAT superfamily N-acetyltransferase